MKFFTPELFVKLQECATPAEFRVVNAEWERAAAAYREQLQRLLPNLKGTLRRFVQRGSLHDAHVLDIGTTERKWTLILQEELVPRLLSLSYALVAEPTINRAAFAPDHRTPQTLWLYDELELEPGKLFDPKRRIEVDAKDASGAGDWKPIYLHSILLSNGWEIRLRFHGLTETRTTSLLRPDPSPRPEDSLSYSTS